MKTLKLIRVRETFRPWLVLLLSLSRIQINELGDCSCIPEFCLICLIAALIFSAGYYSAPIFFFTSSNKKMFRFTSFCRLFNILREIFLTSLG